MNATPLRFTLVQPRVPAVAPARRQIARPSRIWIATASTDRAREWIEGALHLLLLAALVFALGVFLSAM